VGLAGDFIVEVVRVPALSQLAMSFEKRTFVRVAWGSDYTLARASWQSVEEMQ
jgi:hypothetical protein